MKSIFFVISIFAYGVSNAISQYFPTETVDQEPETVRE